MLRAKFRDLEKQWRTQLLLMRMLISLEFLMVMVEIKYPNTARKTLSKYSMNSLI
jgi:hypothetical protein